MLDQKQITTSSKFSKGNDKVKDINKIILKLLHKAEVRRIDNQRISISRLSLTEEFFAGVRIV